VIINHSRKFVFIHVQKTAGLSIEQFLLDEYPQSTKWHGRHGRALDALGDISRSTWESYYSFAFVRNPWDRLASWYAMIDAARKKLSPAERASASPLPSELWNYAIANSHDFESFLVHCTDTIFDLGCNKSFAFNQLDYLTDERGEIVVDFVGRFESLQPTWSGCAEL
jgi:hypothetical protein